MNKGKLIGALALLVVVTTATLFFFPDSGKEDSASSSTILFGMEKDFVTLDPASLTDPITFRIVGQIYESLLGLDENDRAIPAIAESWTSNETADVWTFQIRTGVFFHESPVFGAEGTRELTPEDVIYSISRSVSPGKIAGFALGNVIDGAKEHISGEASSVSGLRVVDGDKVEIKLTRPEPYFPYRLTSPYIAIYPKEAVEQGEEIFAKSKPIGTGPYRIVSASDTEISLAKNEKYWGNLSPSAPAAVRFLVAGNEQLRQLELRNRKLDVAAVTPGMMPAVLQRPASSAEPLKLASQWADSFVIYSHADINSHCIAFNTEKVPLHIRRAVNLAVDRSEVASTLTFGTAIPKWNTVPEGLQGYTPPFGLPEPDPKAAKLALTEGGNQSGAAELEFLVHELDSSETLGELIQSRMKEIGLNVRITKVTFNEAMRRLVGGEYQAMAMKFQYVFSAPEPILDMMFHSSQIPGSNVWRFRNEEMDRLLAGFSSAKGREQLNQAAGAAEKHVYEESPGVFLYQARSVFLHPPELKNFLVNGHGIPLIYRSSLERP